MAELGVKDDRLNDALRLLISKKGADGKWVLEGVWEGWTSEGWSEKMGRGWSDEEGNVCRKGWSSNINTLQLEEAGAPSKWITLNAMRVLRHMRA